MKRSPANGTAWKDSHPREVALGRWDNEGGAVSGAISPDTGVAARAAAAPKCTSTELVQLRIRVIALENLVITLLADGSAGQLARARSMATHVAPRPGFTRHRITLHAATQMLHLIRRASYFRAGRG